MAMNDPNWPTDLAENHAELVRVLSTAVERGADAYVRLVLLPERDCGEWLLGCGRIDLARQGDVELAPELDYGTVRTSEQLVPGATFLDAFGKALRGERFEVGKSSFRNHGFDRLWNGCRLRSQNEFSGWPLIHASTTALPDRPRAPSDDLIRKGLPIRTLDDLTSRLTTWRPRPGWQDGRRDHAFLVIWDYRGRIVRTSRTRISAIFDLEGSALTDAHLAVRVESVRKTETSEPIQAAERTMVSIPACDVSVTTRLFSEVTGVSETLDERPREPLVLADVIFDPSQDDPISIPSQTILDVAAEHEASTGEATSHSRLWRALRENDDEQNEALIQSLMPFYLEYELTPPRQTYRLTFAGWRKSKYGVKIPPLVASVLALLREKLDVEPDFKIYSWDELKARGLDLGIHTPYFAHIVLMRLRLYSGGSVGAWGIPYEPHKLAKATTLDELLKYRDQQKRAAEAAQRERDREVGPHWTPLYGGSTPEFFDSNAVLSELDTLLVPPPPAVYNVNIGAVHQANVSHSTVGVVSQGDNAAVAGDVDLVSATDATETRASEPRGNESRPGGTVAEDRARQPDAEEDDPPTVNDVPGTAAYGSNVSGSQFGSMAVGDQSRAVTVINQGLSFTEAERLFGLLFEQNFPRLAEQARAEARRRVDEFAATFMRVAAAQQVTEEQLAGFSEPDVQFMLNEAVRIAARRNDSELREVLARVLLRRIGEDGRSLEHLLLSSAIDIAGKLTREQLQFLALCYWMRIGAGLAVAPLTRSAWLKLAEIQVSYADRLYLQSAGCLAIEEHDVLPVFRLDTAPLSRDLCDADIQEIMRVHWAVNKFGAGLRFSMTGAVLGALTVEAALERPMPTVSEVIAKSGR